MVEGLGVPGYSFSVLTSLEARASTRAPHAIVSSPPRREADDTTTRDTASPQCTTHDDHDHSRARGPTSTPSLVVLRREAEPSVEGLARVDGRPAAARGAEQRRLGLGV